ncbi:MAG: bactofilin family protein [Candidatus Dormibacterales bacterium]
MAEVELSAVAHGAAQRAVASSTVVAAEDVFEGRLTLSGNGEVQGRFKGRIESDGELLIGPAAEVEATIVGANITVAGLVHGDLTAAGRLKITPTGRLEGDAVVGKLVVQEGGVHHGRIMVHPEGVPGPAPAEVAAPGAHAEPPGGRPGDGRRASPIEAAKKLWGELF